MVACQGEADCVARIGADLSAAEVLLVGVSEFGDVILTLQRIDVKSGKVLTRIAEALAPGDEPNDKQLIGWLKRVLPVSDFLQYGTIRIAASVAGARITIGGRDHGLTPVVDPILVLAPATYDIRISKEGYTAFRASIAVPPDGEVDVRSLLTRNTTSKWWIAAVVGTAAVAIAGVTWLVLSSEATTVPVGGELPPL